VSRNYVALLAGSILFGLGIGTYEFTLPYYLDSVGISVPRMGLIYAIGAIGIYLLRMYAGNLSDRFGRKALYSFSLGLATVAAAVTPSTVVLWLQTLFKSAYDAGAMIFDSMYQLCLHDDDRDKYIGRVGKIQGAQALAAALATVIAGVVVGKNLYSGAFYLASGAFLAAMLAFGARYRTGNQANNAQAAQSSGLRSVLPIGLPRPLLVLALTGFIFTVGLSTSHCFVMQLFWERQFGASRPEIGVILMLHRFTIAVPLLLLRWSARGRLREIFMAFLALEGVILIASGLISNFLIAAAVWLTHDLLGAGVWMPAQSALIQRYSREETRGRDVTQVFALSSLGWVFGPLIAGAVFEHWYGGPFVLSGVLMVVAACVLLLLPGQARAGEQKSVESIG
jgi:MFS family permease